MGTGKKNKNKNLTRQQRLKPKDKKYGFLTSQKVSSEAWSHNYQLSSKSTNQNLLTFTNLEYLLDFFQRSTWHRCLAPQNHEFQTFGATPPK